MKPFGYTSSAPKNQLQQNLHENTREASQPPNEQERITYGVISDVDYESSQVKVKLLKSDGKIGEEITKGFLPLATPLSEIHLLWGALREGLVVRVYWKGKLAPREVIIEVIGDEEHKFLNKTPIQNEIAIGPWRIFSGGLG